MEAEDMPYYVVNARTARGAITSGTHIMQSKNPSTPGVVSDQAANFLWFGGTIKHTLCGREAGRFVDVFTPAEAGCRECRKRWQLAVEADRRETARVAALSPAQRQAEVADARAKAIAKFVIAVLAIVVITWAASTMTHH